MTDWNERQYAKFERERTLPSIDLASAVSSMVATEVTSVLDVGCGGGNSTAVLKKRFPGAKVIGCDNSDNMLAAARKKHPDLNFVKLDAATELSSVRERFDIVFSNACLQWIPDHATLLCNLMGLVNNGGTLAVQMPSQPKLLVRKIVHEVAMQEKWASKIKVEREFHLRDEDDYFNILAGISPDFRLWETTYFHAMPSHQAIVEWYKATGMRPYLAPLSAEDKTEFEADVLERIKSSYPVQTNGEIIFRFPRLFFVARKGD